MGFTLPSLKDQRRYFGFSMVTHQTLRPRFGEPIAPTTQNANPTQNINPTQNRSLSSGTLEVLFLGNAGWMLSFANYF
jgi:hypothetical protein